MILPLTVQAPQGKGKLNVERRRKRRAMHVKRQTDRNMKKITTTVLMNLQVFLIKLNLEESKGIRLNGKETKRNYFETKEKNTQTRKAK